MKKLLILMMVLLFVSCGKKDKKSNRKETPINQSQIEEVLENQVFECASLGGSCPKGVARVFIVDPNNSERSAVCTGFMISPDQMVTNHHCVNTQEECDSTFMAIYNGNADHVRARCQKIIKSEEDVSDPNDPSRKIDYTVMQIDQSFKGDFLPLSNQLAVAKEEIHVWVIDHTGLDKSPSNLFESRLTEFKCTVADQDERDSLFLKKCPIISGNSGSPALNVQGQVIGVIWGGNSTIIDSSLDLEIRRQLNAVGLATEVNYFRSF